MPDETTLDVLISGAGAAGLTLAIELARRGVSFRLIDRLATPFHGSRGKGIQPRTLEVFEDMGVVDRLVAAGGPYPIQRHYGADGTFRDSPSTDSGAPTPQEPYRETLMVPQFLTEGVLRDRLAELGHRPHYASELTGFTQDANGVSIRVTNPAGTQTLRARWLVGGDGGRSFVRHELGTAFPGKTLGVRAIVADVTLSGLSREVWHRYAEGDMEHQVAICPLAGTDLFQIQGPIPSEGEIDLSAEGLTRLLAERTGRADIVVDTVSWASAYVMNARLAERYRTGRVFLMGDAAHIHPPTGGQGLNTSVQDAYNLGWKLAAVLRGAPDALLDSYDRERRPVAADMLGLATGLLAAMKQGDTRRGRDVQQLDIGYFGASPALLASERGGPLRAGDRAPDACLRGAGGQMRRLFDLYRGSHWTLLAFETDAVPLPVREGLHIHAIGPGRELSEEGDTIRQGYGLDPGDCVLVRPDGYVAAIVAPDQRAQLERFLGEVGLSAA